MKKGKKRLMFFLAILLCAFGLVFLVLSNIMMPAASLVMSDFTTKWTYASGLTVDDSIGPLAVDVDHDGKMEVFVSGDLSPSPDKVFCLDGTNGAVKWSATLQYSIVPHNPMEIYDLDNDGNYELIQPGPNALQVLNAEDGTIYWCNPSIKCSEAHQLVLDTDGNGFPYIYTCNADANPPCDAILRKVDGRTGETVRSVSIYYPCHGGLSAADVEGDGDFEIFMSDRNAGMNPLGKGPQCYDADTLELLWSRPDILCSSHLPVLVDVNNDGVLDVVVSQQRHPDNAGIYCLDGRTGEDIPGKCQDAISGLAVHEAFPVYDIDGDGNLELTTCVYGATNVFDLGKWQIEATLAVNGKAPYYANVAGDGALEIILSNNVPAIRIYNNRYQLIRTINMESLNSVVQDIDGDGLNELVTVNANGVITALDTLAVASNPLPRTNTEHYSERRTRTAEYIPPPGEKWPVTSILMGNLMILGSVACFSGSGLLFFRIKVWKFIKGWRP